MLRHTHTPHALIPISSISCTTFSGELLTFSSSVLLFLVMLNAERFNAWRKKTFLFLTKWLNNAFQQLLSVLLPDFSLDSRICFVHCLFNLSFARNREILKQDANWKISKISNLISKQMLFRRRRRSSSFYFFFFSSFCIQYNFMMSSVRKRNT